MLDSVVQDVRFALRTFRRSPGFALAVAFTIGLGVAATTSLFTVVNSIVLRPLPFPDSERVYAFCETNPAVASYCVASPANVADWARSSPALDAAGVARTEPLIGRGGEGNYGVAGGIASPGFFRTLRLHALHGRVIEDRDMPRGANHVAVVSHAYWQRRLSGSRAAIGQPIILDNEPYTVVGVLPPDAWLPGAYLSTVEVWKPLTASIDDVENRAWRGFTAIGRVANGTSVDRLRAELDTVRARLALAYPQTNAKWGLRIMQLREQVVGATGNRLWIFLGVTGLVLLIVCANVAALLLVRASRRTTEFAVRGSLGGSPRRVLQQLVTESLVLSLAGGAAGLLLATWVTRAFVALAPPGIPRLNEVGVDGRVVVFALMASVLTAIVFGAAPARHAVKTDLNTVLRGGPTMSGAGRRSRSALVVMEVALALMLLVAACLLTRSFARLLAWEPGFERAGLTTVWMLAPTHTDAVGLMERVRDEVATIPGVREVGMGSAGPLFGGSETGTLTVSDQPPDAPGNTPTVEWFDADPHYFAALGVRLVRGRNFTADDRDGANPVAVVNEALVRRFFGPRNAIGERVTVQNHQAEIVGVVSDIKPLRPDEAPTPQIYWPIRQYRRLAAYLTIRSSQGVTGLEKVVRQRAAQVNSGIQLSPMVTLDERFADNMVSPRFNMLLVLAFAVVALLLAAVGVYGVMAFSVASRRREMAIHVALGATPRQLVGSVIGEGMKLAAIGIAAGTLAAIAAGRLLTSLLYGLPAADPVSLAAAIGLFALVALAACWLPARAASEADPVTALRADA